MLGNRLAISVGLPIRDDAPIWRVEQHARGVAQVRRVLAKYPDRYRLVSVRRYVNGCPDRAAASGSRVGEATTTTWLRPASKVNAVNCALTDARAAAADVLLTIDDDLVFDEQALLAILEPHRTGVSQPTATAASKAPWTEAYSSNFQRLYSYAVAASFIGDLFPKRPSGSFVALDVSSFASYPKDCNEGDVLATLGIRPTGTVYSPYPRSFHEEVRRRRRLDAASRAVAFVRCHDEPDWLDASVPSAARVNVQPAAYRASIALWERVRAEARCA